MSRVEVSKDMKYCPDKICPKCGHKGLWFWEGWHCAGYVCPVHRCNYEEGWATGVKKMDEIIIGGSKGMKGQKMITWKEVWRMIGYKAGYKAGYEAGYEAGYDNGWCTGYEDGLEDGELGYEDEEEEH